LTGAHLGDLAVVQHHAADQLDVEMAHPHRAAADLAYERERLREQLVEVLALDGALAQRRELLLDLVVLEELQLGLPGVDQLDATGIRLELLCFAHPEGALEDRHGYLA